MISLKPIIELTVALLFCSFLQVTAGTFGDLTYEVIGGTQVRITDCATSASGLLEIPATIEGKPVIYIGYQAFMDCSGITAIRIPENVTEISSLAFYNCSGLMTVTLPTSIGSLTLGIGTKVFENCSHLVRCIFKGDEPSNFGTDVFKDTAAGFTIYYGDDASGFSSPQWEGYDAESFDSTFSFDVIAGSPETIEVTGYPTNEVGTVDIPSQIAGLSITSIGNYTFSECSLLTRISLPSQLTHIGEGAFGECGGLTTFTIPSHVTEIESDAFIDCLALASIFFEGNAPQLGFDIIDSVAFGFKIYYLHEYEQGFTDGESPRWVEFQGLLVEYNGLYDFDVVAETIKITDYPTTETGALTIPETLVGKPVTRIGESAFYHCSGLTRITLPSTLTSIYLEAFDQCTALTTITIPAEVTSIDNGAYIGCSLDSVFFEGNAPSVGLQAFGGAPTVYYRNGKTGFSTPTWHGYTTEAYTNLFSFIVVAEEIEITDYPTPSADLITVPAIIVGKPVTRIGDNAFSGNAWVNHFSLPNVLTHIGRDAFNNCDDLIDITIPASVTNIGYAAFNNCDFLVSVNVETGNPDYSSLDGVLFNKIQTQVIHFPAHKTEDDYSIPQGVTHIADYAFYAAWNTQNLTLPSSLTHIGYKAFGRCFRMENIVFFGDAPIVASEVFYEPHSTLELYYPSHKTGYTSPTWQGVSCNSFEGLFTFQVEGYPGSVTITDYPEDETGIVEIPAILVDLPVQTIGPDAFRHCGDLTSISIPGSVTLIGEDAFSQTYNLTNFVVDAANADYASPDGVLFNKSLTRLYKYPAKRLGDYNPPEQLRVVVENAFIYCYDLSAITFPELLETIHNSAFYGCMGLTRITIPGEVDIYSQAFKSCTGLETVIFSGSGLNIFGSEVFHNTAPDFMIYYFSDKPGFSTPVWNGYPITEIDRSIYPAAEWLLGYDLEYDADLSTDISGDGVSLLMEYALDLDPRASQTGNMLQFQANESILSITYHATSEGVTYSVDTTTNLLEACTSNGVSHTAIGPNNRRTSYVTRNGPHQFLRLKVVAGAPSEP